MRIGLIQRLYGRPDGEHPAPTWDAIRTAVTTAEQIGFDTFVFEDALLYRGTDATDGCWESVSIAAAVATVTSRIEFGQSVVNSPYRSPALLAKIADTIAKTGATKPTELAPTLRKRGKYYSVKPGDTLKSIAENFSTTPEAIRKENHIPVDKEPIPGSQIYIITEK